MKELTLRLRGAKLVDELLNKKKPGKASNFSSDTGSNDDLTMQEGGMTATELAKASGDLLYSDNDVETVTSLDSETSYSPKKRAWKTNSPLVIQDSEPET